MTADGDDRSFRALTADSQAVNFQGNFPLKHRGRGAEVNVEDAQAVDAWMIYGRAGYRMAGQG